MNKVQKIVKKYTKFDEAQKLKVGDKKNTFLIDKVENQEDFEDIVLSAQDIVLNPFQYTLDQQDSIND